MARGSGTLEAHRAGRPSEGRPISDRAKAGTKPYTETPACEHSKFYNDFNGWILPGYLYGKYLIFV